MSMSHQWYMRAVTALAVLVTVVVSGSIPQSSLRAQGALASSPEKGAELANRLCSRCHLMEGDSTTAVPAGIITLRGIANRPGQTGQRILDVLILPHAPMPDMRLSISEINSIIAYLETLRTNGAVRP